MGNLQFALDNGLTEEEYARVISSLGREPNPVEIGMIAAMWSEHCSYKSSRIFLKRFPTKGKRVIQGPGENAGIVDIEDGLCVAFKMESHNHPSFIEPYQGAATGVGGILRDIFTMGARPIAILDSLRFGDPSLSRTRYIVGGVVAGISGYGNCVGVPTVGGEVYFDDCYNGNPLVNVLALGIARKDRIFRGKASGVGNPIVYVGAKTGRDGIRGAVMASEAFSKESEEKRPAVQVGDPFTEKLLLEACLELFKTGVVVGIQDMGAAGLTSSSTEMASRAGTGIKLDIDRVPKRELGMNAYEVMLSESQERMLLVVEGGKEDVAERVFRKWGLDFAIIGKVSRSRNITITEKGKKVAELPISLLTDDAPTYRRHASPPSYIRKVTALANSSIPMHDDFGPQLLKILASPNIASKRWIYEQYDYMVRTNTVIPPGSDAAILRIKGTHKGVAITTNCNSRYCYLDPFIGAAIAVAESARNLACGGARPIAITDCLNFGNPERPDVMWQFARATSGIAKAARALGTPVVSGNVSFYNETEGTSIYPTPTIGMVGLIENINCATSQWFDREGDLIVLLGETGEEFGGSEYLKVVHGITAGKPPSLDLNRELSLINLLVEATTKGLIKSAHDVSEGGLAVAISECCFTGKGNVGASLEIPQGGIREDALLFSESQGRAIVSLDKDHLNALETLAHIHDIPLHVIGRVGGDRLRFSKLIDIPVENAYLAWARGFEDSLKAYA
jgi:phosphoribosylformylglycinamidine synthase